jgi:hypothetical protein
MKFATFDEQDQEALRILGFNFLINRTDDYAALAGEMKIEIHRSGENKLALVITLPNGREIGALVPREILHEALLD